MRIIITENQLNNLFLSEARFVSDNKYEYIIKNLGGLLFNELSNNPLKVKVIPEINRFESFLKINRNVNIKNEEDIVYNLDEFGDWLKYFNDKEFARIMNGIYSVFPNIKKSVNTFNVVKRDPSLPPSKSGRPLGSTKKPNKVIHSYSRVLSRRPIEPKDVEIEPVNVSSDNAEFSQGDMKSGSEEMLKKRGRRPKDDGFSNYERSKFQKEGPGAIEKLENKALELDKKVDEIINKIKSLYDDANKRRKFFKMD